MINTRSPNGPLVGSNRQYNNSKHDSTSFSPFEALYGFSPITPPTLLNSHLSTPSNLIEHIHDIHSFIIEQLKIAKRLQSHYANKKRIDKQFSIGDKVMLDTSNIFIRSQPKKKFKQKFLGPYPIVKVISPVSYELQLPGTMQIHPVFHVSKLKETVDSNSPIDIVAASDESKNEYQVDYIFDYKVDIFPNIYKRTLPIVPC